MAWTKKKTILTIIVSVVGLICVFIVIGVSIDYLRRKRYQKFVVGNAFNRVTDDSEHAADNARLRKEIWPREKAAMEARINARQQVNDTTNAVTIDLKPYLNAKLTDAPVCWSGNNGNNLGELPAGTNIYGGVPFDVEGAIYLTGGWLKQHYHKHFPKQVKDIQIGQACKRIHLLNGAALISFNQSGNTIAKLVLHYDDGKSEELPIVAGKHVWDMWAPLFSTGVNPQNLKTPPGTEPAWTGSNPWIQKFQPDESLVLYKATLINPRPNIKVVSIDYVSAETVTVPFMVGLTVE